MVGRVTPNSSPICWTVQRRLPFWPMSCRFAGPGVPGGAELGVCPPVRARTWAARARRGFLGHEGVLEFGDGAQHHREGCSPCLALDHVHQGLDVLLLLVVAGVVIVSGRVDYWAVVLYAVARAGGKLAPCFARSGPSGSPSRSRAIERRYGCLTRLRRHNMNVSGGSLRGGCFLSPRGRRLRCSRGA